MIRTTRIGVLALAGVSALVVVLALATGGADAAPAGRAAMPMPCR